MGNVHEALAGEGGIGSARVADGFQLCFKVTVEILHHEVMIRLVPGGAFQDRVVKFFQGSVIVRERSVRQCIKAAAEQRVLFVNLFRVISAFDLFQFLLHQ